MCIILFVSISAAAAAVCLLNDKNHVPFIFRCPNSFGFGAHREREREREMTTDIPPRSIRERVLSPSFLTDLSHEAGSRKKGPVLFIFLCVA